MKKNVKMSNTELQLIINELNKLDDSISTATVQGNVARTMNNELFENLFSRTTTVENLNEESLKNYFNFNLNHVLNDVTHTAIISTEKELSDIQESFHKIWNIVQTIKNR